MNLKILIALIAIGIFSISNVYSLDDNFVIIIKNAEKKPEITKIKINDFCKGECEFVTKNIQFSPPKPSDYTVNVMIDFRWMDSINANMTDKKRDLVENYHMYPGVMQTYDIFESTNSNIKKEIYYFNGTFNIFKSNTIGMAIKSFDMEGNYSLPEQQLVIAGN